MSPGRPVVVRLRPGSDGDATHVPPPGVYTMVNPPTLYLEKTAQQWMARRGEVRPGLKYILESLPVGYSMWQRPRPGNAKHIDKYLYGHPDHKPFDSPNRFYPHFEYLMENGGNSIGCDCKICAGSVGILPSKSAPGSARTASSSSSVASPRPHMPKVPASSTRDAQPFHKPVALPKMVAAIQPRGRPKQVSAGLDSTRVDEEGTPDVYRNLIDRLQRIGVIDEVIEEPLSPDWRAERHLLPELLTTLTKQEEWVPRHGEIVLFIRDVRKNFDVVRLETSAGLQLVHKQTSQASTPLWEAGLISQASATVKDMTDLLDTDESTKVIYAGVRVEPLPDPNSSDKSLSKRYKYVHVQQTRPFILWKELLYHIPEDEWHPTIKHALTLTCNLSIMGKHRFKGVWPNATIYCHAAYLGFEMLAVGDTVRLLPNNKHRQTTCVDIMVIKSIRLKWTNMDKASSNDYDEGRPYNSEIWVYGSAYTSDSSRSNKEWLCEANVEPPKASAEYTSWYPLHPADKELAVPYFRVMGRLYERDAMTFFLGASPSDPPDLDIGREGLLEARSYSRTNDRRIAQEPGATWYWGDSRAEALQLQTINGLETTRFDRDRDIRDMRKKIKIMDGMQSVSAAVPGRGLRDFMAPSLPLRPSTSRENSVSNATTASASTEDRGHKRSHVIDLSDGADDDEFQQSTRVIEGDTATSAKKVRVMVVIDD